MSTNKTTRLGIEADKALEDIARSTLEIETLEARRCDALDFHEVSVWNIRKALEEAYKIGVEAAMKRLLGCAVESK